MSTSSPSLGEKVTRGVCARFSAGALSPPPHPAVRAASSVTANRRRVMDARSAIRTRVCKPAGSKATLERALAILGPPMSRPPVTALAFDVPLGPELEAAMAEHRAEVDAIAAGPWPPAFEDTIAALERAGQRLHLAEQLLSDASGTRSTPELRALEAELLPRLAAHHDAIRLDSRVFARVAELVARRDALGLDAEQAAVLERY